MWVILWSARQCINIIHVWPVWCTARYTGKCMYVMHCYAMYYTGYLINIQCVWCNCVMQCKIHKQVQKTAHVCDLMTHNAILCDAMHKDALANASSYALRYTGNCIIPNICVMQCMEIGGKCSDLQLWLMQWCATYWVWCNAHINTANARIQQIHHIY